MYITTHKSTVKILRKYIASVTRVWSSGADLVTWKRQTPRGIGFLSSMICDLIEDNSIWLSHIQYIEEQMSTHYDDDLEMVM